MTPPGPAPALPHTLTRDHLLAMACCACMGKALWRKLMTAHLEVLCAL
jgi:hypothetical protein